MPDDPPCDLTEARLGVMRALNESDEWDGIATHLDGDATRILAIDNGSSDATFWIVTVTPAQLVTLPTLLIIPAE